MSLSLRDFRIDEAKIRGIGGDSVWLLAACGYETAADFVGGGVNRVWNGFGHESVAFLTEPNGQEYVIRGLGPGKVTALLAWREAVQQTVRAGPSAAAASLERQLREILGSTRDIVNAAIGLQGAHSFDEPDEARAFLARLEDIRRGLEACKRGLTSARSQVRQAGASEPYLALLRVRLLDEIAELAAALDPARSGVADAIRELRQQLRGR